MRQWGEMHIWLNLYSVEGNLQGFFLPCFGIDSKLASGLVRHLIHDR